MIGLSRLGALIGLIGGLTLLASGARAEVAMSIAQVRPLLIGQSAPNAVLLDLEGRETSLEALLTKQQAVVVFFRGGWCPYCTKQLQQLQQIMSALGQAHYQVIAISPDPPEQLRGFKSERGLKFDVYSDPGGAAAERFGLAYRVGPADFGGDAMFASWRDVAPEHRSKAPRLPVPAVFLTLPSRIIVYQYVNIDVNVRLSAEVLLTAARAYGQAG